MTRNEQREMVGKSLDHWILWKLEDHNLLVESRLDGPGGFAVQEFLFTADFKPIGYNVSAVTQQSKNESKEDKWFLSCKLLPQHIRCKSEFDGKKEPSELAVKESTYAFMPEEFYGLDFTWFFVMLIQNQGRDVERPVYMFGENDSGQPIIEGGGLVRVRLLGPETLIMMAKIVKANKYEIDFGDEDSGLEKLRIWVLPSTGMVLAVGTADKSYRWELAKFKSYSSGFIPELQ
jgi:hypothetical protein